jgi:uncharacterized protein
MIKQFSTLRAPTQSHLYADWTMPQSTKCSARPNCCSRKKTVDEDRRQGRFLLTGSANVLTLTKVADSLAGRMETIQLLPLARVELLGQKTTFLDSLFAAKIPKPKNILLGETLIEAVLAGGFPEALGRAN